ncbi:MAG TPA: hypothetical protein VMS18_21965 [Candidatus Binatia bacterium]|nr:hypothetical protein [Candidatus Binatia bacterium]
MKTATHWPRGAIASGPAGIEVTLTTIRDDVARFLDTYLRGGLVHPSPTGSSGFDPNAVSMGDRSCSQP